MFEIENYTAKLNSEIIRTTKCKDSDLYLSVSASACSYRPSNVEYRVVWEFRGGGLKSMNSSSPSQLFMDVIDAIIDPMRNQLAGYDPVKMGA